MLGGGALITHTDPVDAVGWGFRIVFESLAFSSYDPDAVPPPLRRAIVGFREQLSAMVLAT